MYGLVAGDPCTCGCGTLHDDHVEKSTELAVKIGKQGMWYLVSHMIYTAVNAISFSVPRVHLYDTHIQMHQPPCCVLAAGAPRLPPYDVHYSYLL